MAVEPRHGLLDLDGHLHRVRDAVALDDCYRIAGLDDAVAIARMKPVAFDNRDARAGSSRTI